jgi:hypothetical protein
MKRQILFVLIVCFTALSLGAQTRGDAYEPNDSASAAYPLALGRFNLTFTADDEDWFTFRLSSPSMIRISTEGSLDTYLELYGPNSSSSEVASDDDTGDGYNAKITTYLSEAGTYYINVLPYDGAAGSYVLVLETVNLSGDSMEPNNSRVQAKPLNLSRLPLALSLFPDNDYDWFALDLSAFRYRTGEVISFYTSGDTDTYMELYQGDVLVVENDDGSGDEDGYNARITFKPERGGGDYYLRIQGYDDGVLGEYTLHTETSTVDFDQYEPNNVKTQATRITLEQTLSGNALADYDMVDWFTFSITEAGTYVISTTGGVDTVIYLYDSSDRELASDDDGGNNNNARIEMRLERGTYYAKVSQYGAGYGEYSFYVRQR